MASLISSLVPCRMQVFCRLLADKLGVKVVQRGKEICADVVKKIIYLPSMEYPTEKALHGVRGMALHEAAHLKWTTVDPIKKCSTIFERNLLNAIEDERIEVKAEGTFPGARQMFIDARKDGLEHVFGEKQFIAPVSYLSPEGMKQVMADAFSFFERMHKFFGETPAQAKKSAEEAVEKIKNEGKVEAAAKRLEFERATFCWLYTNRKCQEFIDIPEDWEKHPWKPIFDRVTMKRAKNTEQALEQARKIIKEIGLEELTEEDGWHALQKKAEEAAQKAAQTVAKHAEAEREAKKRAKEKADNSAIGNRMRGLQDRVQRCKDKVNASKNAKLDVRKLQDEALELGEQLEEAKKELENARENNKKRQEELKDKEKNFSDAENNLAQAQKDYEKAQNDAKDGKITEAEVSKAEKSVRNARKQVKKAKEELKEAQENAKAFEKAKRREAYLKDKIKEVQNRLDAAKELSNRLSDEASAEKNASAEDRRELKWVKKQYKDILSNELNSQRKELNCEELSKESQAAMEESKEARDAAEKVAEPLKNYEKGMLIAGLIEVLEKAWEEFRDQSLKDTVMAVVGGDDNNLKEKKKVNLRNGDPDFDGPARSYCVYDRKHDKVTEINASPENDEEARNAKEQYGPMVPPMIEALRKLRPPTIPVVKVNVERGRPNPKQLFKIGVAQRGACNVDVRRIWKTTHDIPAPKLAVSILVDCSGSMGGKRIEQAQMTACALHETLKALNIPHEILGHTTDSSKVIYKPLDPEEQLVPQGVNVNDFSRFIPFHGLVFKRFDQDTPPNGLFACEEKFGMHENIDGEAVSWAALRLMQRSEKFKLLISVCDGLPSASLSIRGELERHLRTVCRSLESLEPNGFYLFGIGIGIKNIKHYYRHYEILKNVEDLPQVCFKIIEGILGKSIGVRTKYTAEREKKEAEEDAAVAV